MVKKLTKLQFQSFLRPPLPEVFDRLIEEHDWYADSTETTLGVLFRDTTYNDWGFAVLQSGVDSVFRWSSGDSSIADIQDARHRLSIDMERVIEDSETTGAVEVAANLALSFRANDPFIPIVPRPKLNPMFELVAKSGSYSPARGMIKEVFGCYEDHDGNFVEQLQTTGFDSRIWELYLYAFLIESGFSLQRGVSPDFVVSKGETTIAIEAVTANPTQASNSQHMQPVYSPTRLLVPPFDFSITQTR
jgi:hypothetical protein